MANSTGKERDAETGNDDFGARYYSNRFGRWLSADWSAVPVPVPYANLTNPQTLNLYAMVSDDPESFADLDGHEGGLCYGCGPNGTTVTPLDSGFPKQSMSDTEKQIDTGILEIASAIATEGISEEAAAAGHILKAALTGVTSSGLAVSGMSRVLMTVAGVKPEATDKAASAVTTVTNPVGYAVAIGTKNMSAATTATDVATAVTTKPSEAVKDPAGTALTLGNLAKDAKGAYQMFKNIVAPPAPPPPQTPKPPALKAAKACTGASGACTN